MSSTAARRYAGMARQFGAEDARTKEAHAEWRKARLQQVIDELQGQGDNRLGADDRQQLAERLLSPE